MSQLLFLVGLGLMFVGKINVGDINAEGRVVRAAGAMLMLPLIAVLVLSQVLNWLNGSTIGGKGGGVVFLLIIELGGMVICSAAAYMMLKRASEDENGGKTETINPSTTVNIRPKDEKPSAPPPIQQSPKNGGPRPTGNGSGYSDLMRPRVEGNNVSRKREDFPAVMDIRDAARYLNKTEKEVMKLIDQGKLAAARINYRFRISRTVLDDFIEEQNNSSETPST